MYAEQHGAAIDFSLRQAEGKAFVFGDGLQGATLGVKSLPKATGVYSIWMATKSSLNLFIPIYLGYTSRDFPTRLSEHCVDGAIYKAYTNPIIKPAGGIGVICNSIDWATARSVEAALLELFDFAYNTADNTAARNLVIDSWSEADLQQAAKFPTEPLEIDVFNEVVGAFDKLKTATAALAHEFDKLKK